MRDVDRTPRPCLHKQANHRHGTYATYVLDKCRCTDCSTARSTWDRNRVRSKAYGRWNGLVDAEPARRHVLALMASGMGLKVIARAAGVSTGGMSNLIYGKYRQDGPRIPSRRVRPEVAEKLLSVRLALAPGSVVEPVGSARRIQALVSLGWSVNRLSAASGLNRQCIDNALKGCDIEQRTATCIRALYDELWDARPPEATHREKIAASRSRNRALAHGWAPPMAWDDDSIDDPAASPDLGETIRGIDLDEVAFLARQGLVREVIAQRTGASWAAIEKAIYRAERVDILHLIRAGAA